MDLAKHIPDIFASPLDFDAAEQKIWEYQLNQNPIIAKFCEHLGTQERVFIPIDFFKQFQMICGESQEDMTLFQSSGTTGQQPSQHFVKDISLYQRSLMQGYHHFYKEGERTLFALLPNYLERGNSSLVRMVQEWMIEFGLPGSGFYLNDLTALHKEMTEAMDRREPILLIGVTYALLDFAAEFQLKLPPDAIVMETGGMKGRRKEMIRTEVHQLLQTGFGVENIHSEYGMTELLSQAYALKDGRFQCPPWMKVTVSDPYLPYAPLPYGQTGRLLITDLANIHSCSFIRTDDIGKMYPDGSFEVLGRLDFAEMRGCNLMYE